MLSGNKNSAFLCLVISTRCSKPDVCRPRKVWECIATTQIVHIQAVEGWRGGGVQWRAGGVEVSVEGWRVEVCSGGVEGWRGGGVQWRGGGVEGWRGGGV